MHLLTPSGVFWFLLMYYFPWSLCLVDSLVSIILIREKILEHEEKVKFRLIEEQERGSRSKPTTPVPKIRIPSERTPSGKLSELELKLARRMKMNGEEVPGIVHLNM